MAKNCEIWVPHPLKSDFIQKFDILKPWKHFWLGKLKSIRNQLKMVFSQSERSKIDWIQVTVWMKILFPKLFQGNRAENFFIFFFYLKLKKYLKKMRKNCTACIRWGKNCQNIEILGNINQNIWSSAILCIKCDLFHRFFEEFSKVIVLKLLK